jgi:hypothetical protein
MATDEPTQVITTVLLQEGNDAHWTVTDLGAGMMLLQDCALNVGIMGTRHQLATMLDRMRSALIGSINVNREAPVNVN